MHEDEWVITGPHQFVDCWCGHNEISPLSGKTLDIKLDRVHQWIALACPDDCMMQSRVHGHVHVHCPDCADAGRDPSSCC